MTTKLLSLVMPFGMFGAVLLQTTGLAWLAVVM